LLSRPTCLRAGLVPLILEALADVLSTSMSDKSPLPEPSDFPAGTEFVIKEFDVPLVRVPGKGWFNWFGGTPHSYDERSLRVDNNWAAGSFEEWIGVVEMSLRDK
jgi:hypothetical protein